MVLRRRACSTSKRPGGGLCGPALPRGGHFVFDPCGDTGQLARCLRRDLRPSSDCVPPEHLLVTQLVCLHKWPPLLAYFWALAWDQRVGSSVAKSCSWYTFGPEYPRVEAPRAIRTICAAFLGM
jgi:hypothetical protein